MKNRQGKIGVLVNPYLIGALHKIAVATYKIPRLSFEARLIEYDFAHKNITGEAGQRILDVGCCGSKLPVELAKKGHEVYGIDVGSYPDQGAFTFIQGDITHMPFDDEFFDVVMTISTIEHVGLGRYGDPIAPDGDKEAMHEIERVLKPGGQLIMTIPCGQDTICYSKTNIPLSRVYSPESLVRLLSGFQVMECAYIVKRKRVWLPASMKEAEEAVRRAKPERTGMVAIALIVAYKDKK